MNKNYVVVLINYNNWQDTKECIDSILDACILIENILVVDNNSTNNSIKELGKIFPQLNLISLEKNVGFSAANNIGIKEAEKMNKDYIILLNNDTLVRNDSLQIIIKEMENNQNYSIGTGRIFYYPHKNKIWYDGGKIVKWRGLAIHYNYKKDASRIRLNNNLKEVNFVSGCLMCIRTKDIPKLGYLNENFFLYLEDIEYSERAIKNNLKLKYVPEAIIYHKARGENKLTPQMVYYSLRNRKLLIKLHFGITAKLYFEIVLLIKRILWFCTRNKFYSILISSIKDYNRNYFGQAPESIK